MLNKEFVPYEQALALKELGFDEPCFGKYLSFRQSDWKIYELILEMGMNEEFEDNRNIYLLEKACSAPTFSQAFRWFREKGFLIDFSSHDKDIHEFYIRWSPNKSILSDTYATYEEAENACIDILIEIVKNEINKTR